MIDQTISLRNGEKTVKHNHASEPINATRTNVSHKLKGFSRFSPRCIIGLVRREFSVEQMLAEKDGAIT
jgi:hypothetical protein